MRLSSFPEILENAVPFVTGNFQKFKQELLVEWKALQICGKGNIITWYMYPQALIESSRELKLSFLFGNKLLLALIDSCRLSATVAEFDPV